MIVYLYAISDASCASADLVGIAGEPLRTLAVEALVALAGELPEVPAADAATLLAQDRLVRALHDRATALLPMRFGSSFLTREAAAHALRQQQASLAERLETVRGREQMTLRVLGPPAPDAASSSRRGSEAGPGAQGALGEPGAAGALGAVEASAFPAVAPSGAKAGTAYLRNRARPPAIGPLLDALSPMTRARLVELGRTQGLVATIHHLIDRGSSQTYREVVSRAASDHPDWTIRVTGPSPCYAFCR